MNKIFIFDIDGTLTPSRRPMTDDFENFFFKWANNNIFYLVSGSDLDKIKEQVPDFILGLAEGVFTCGGNKLHINESLIYEHSFKPPKKLIKYLEKQIKESPYFTRCGNHIEDRGSMLNFSIVGRDCTLEERKTYFEYDKKTKERQKISTEINILWPELNAVIGGQISIDIAPIGYDKSQVIKEVKLNRNIPDGRYIFIGDRTMEGGNDYPLAILMDNTKNCDFYQAGEPSAEDGYKSTQKILKKLID